MNQSTVPALVVEKMVVTFLRHRGVWGVLPLIPLVLWLIHLYRRMRLRVLRIRGTFGAVLRYTGVRWFVRWMRLPSHLLRPQTVCDELSLTVPGGSIHGVFGVNGAGKSSLLRAIAGLEPCTSGRVIVHGVDLARASPKEIAGVISRSNREFAADFSVLDNVEVIARLYGLEPIAAREVATKLLMRLGVTENDIKKYPGNLSLGSQGKVALVRALIPILGHRSADAPPPILILDEPTLGFDPMAVEQFFAALRELRENIPGLTIVLATNDPREMGVCDDYTAIIGGKEAHDGETFRGLKASVVEFGKAIRAAASLIGRPIAAKASVSAPDSTPLGSIPASKTPPANALAWRHWRDLKRNVFAAFMVAASLVVPSLAALFATDRDPWHGLVLGTVAIFATLMVRDAYRFLSRERDYYNMLETVIASPVSRLSHFIVTARCAILTQLGQTAIFSILLGLLMLSRIMPGLQNGGGLFIENCVPLLIVVVGIVVTSYAVGIATALIPFVTAGQIMTFFFVTLIPMLVTTCGGVYYDVSKLPPLLTSVAALNPLTYGANAVSDFLHLQRTSTEFSLNETVSQLFPGLGYGWVNIVSMFTLAVPAFMLSAGAYWYLEPILRRAGRLRNVRG